MVRAITFDAFGTLVDEGPDVLIGIAREICKDHRPSLRPDALLAAWGRYLYSGADLEPFRSLSKLTRESLGKTFRDHRIEADPNPYVESLESCWRQAKAYPEVRRVLKVLEGVPRAIVSDADDALLEGVLERNRLRFDAVITSESIRAYKPRPQIFQAALRALRANPADVVHVGNSLREDVAGRSARSGWPARHDRTGPRSGVDGSRKPQGKEAAALCLQG
ncbi:MAG: HAD family hydrolase [Methanobacteriota archaeon]|nr:MAG: HAD family hydrolase [Euryarchaeota archaeon]